MITKAELKKLKKRLKEVSGYRQKLSEKTNLSLSYIDSVLNLNNKRYNHRIIDAAFEVLDEFDKDQKEKKAQRERTLNRK